MCKGRMVLPYHKRACVAIIPLHLQVDISVPGLDGVHDLPKVLGIPDVCSKGRADAHNLVSHLQRYLSPQQCSMRNVGLLVDPGGSFKGGSMQSACTSSCGSVFPILGSDLTTYAPPSPPLVNLTPSGFGSVTYTCTLINIKVSASGEIGTGLSTVKQQVKSRLFTS